MSSSLPVISGRQAIAAFAKLGYAVMRQRGSHVRLINSIRRECRPLTIPLHPELDRGLLRALIRTAGISVEEFTALL
jgi:predicted RNA binding protein YcfA (HicA-like mRNA interferase family)